MSKAEYVSRTRTRKIAHGALHMCFPIVPLFVVYVLQPWMQRQTNLPLYLSGAFVAISIHMGVRAYQESIQKIWITGPTGDYEISPNIDPHPEGIPFSKLLLGGHPIFENARSPLYTERALYWSLCVCSWLLVVIVCVPEIFYFLRIGIVPENVFGSAKEGGTFNPLETHLVLTTFVGIFGFTFKSLRDEMDRKWRHVNDLLSKYLTSRDDNLDPDKRTEMLRSIQMRQICQTIIAYDLWSKSHFPSVIFGALFHSVYYGSEEKRVALLKDIATGNFSRKDALSAFSLIPGDKERETIATLEREVILSARKVTKRNDKRLKRLS